MKTKRFAALPAIVVMAVVAHPAQATDTAIVSGQTETTTQILPGPGDTLSVEGGGKVSVSGNGVEMNAASQLLTNRGVVEALGGAGHGVVVNGAAARIRNHGTISTNGLSSYGIHSTALNTELVNFGGIITYADCAYGVYAMADYFSITNNGTISTRANNSSYGVYVENANHAVVVNNGMIDTAGTTANGITLWGSQTSITNSGTLTTSGAGAIGIYAWYGAGLDSRNVVTNSGTIRTSGTGAQAIYANARGMTVINSGTVASQQAEAIYMGQADQTLTLLAGSVVEGGIRFDQAASATLNIGQGLNARLTLTGVPGVINTNGQAYDLAGNVLVVVSAEATGAGGTAAAAANGAVAGTVRGHVDGRRAGLSGGSGLPLAYAPTPAAPDFPNFAPNEDFGAWVSAYGGATAPGNGKAGIQTSQGGGLMGFDARLSEDSLAGLFAGLGGGVVRLSGGSSVETTTLVGGGYGAVQFGSAFVDATASIGATFSRSARQVINNMVTGGVETANGQYSGAFVSPSVTLGFDHDLGPARLTPSISVLYAGIYQGGYAETNSASNLTLGSQVTHVLNARGEIELGTLKLDDMPGGWRAGVKVGAEGTITEGGAVSAALPGGTITLAGNSSTEARGFIGASLGFTQGGYDFSAKGEVGYSTSGMASASIQGAIGVRF